MGSAGGDHWPAARLRAWRRYMAKSSPQPCPGRKVNRYATPSSAMAVAISSLWRGLGEYSGSAFAPIHCRRVVSTTGSGAIREGGCGPQFFHPGCDPGVGLFEAFAEGAARRPGELLLDQAVVGVAAADAEGAGDMAHAELLAGDLHNDLGQAVDGDHLLRADVDGAGKIRFHEAADAFQAFVDE